MHYKCRNPKSKIQIKKFTQNIYATVIFASTLRKRKSFDENRNIGAVGNDAAKRERERESGETWSG